MTNLTEMEKNDIICALEIAIEQYMRDAKAMHELGPSHARLSALFDEQVKRAEALIDKIGQGSP